MFFIMKEEMAPRVGLELNFSSRLCELRAIQVEDLSAVLILTKRYISKNQSSYPDISTINASLNNYSDRHCHDF